MSGARFPLFSTWLCGPSATCDKVRMRRWQGELSEIALFSIPGADAENGSKKIILYYAASANFKNCVFRCLRADQRSLLWDALWHKTEKTPPLPVASLGVWALRSRLR